jgi:hypothetical protein
MLSLILLLAIVLYPLNVQEFSFVKAKNKFGENGLTDRINREEKLFRRFCLCGAAALIILPFAIGFTRSRSGCSRLSFYPLEEDAESTGPQFTKSWINICAICYSPFKNGERIITHNVQECQKRFHPFCLKKWIVFIEGEKWNEYNGNNRNARMEFSEWIRRPGRKPSYSCPCCKKSDPELDRKMRRLDSRTCFEVPGYFEGLGYSGHF